MRIHFFVLALLMVMMNPAVSAQEMWAGPSGYVWEYGPLYRASTWYAWDKARVLYQRTLVAKRNRTAMAHHQALMNRIEDNGYIYTAAETLLGPPGLDYNDGLYSGILSELPTFAALSTRSSSRNISPRTSVPLSINTSLQKQTTNTLWFFQNLRNKNRINSTKRPDRKFQPTLEPLELRDELTLTTPIVHIAIEQEPETIRKAVTSTYGFSYDMSKAYNIPRRSRRTPQPNPMFHNEIGLKNFLNSHQRRLVGLNIETSSLPTQIDMLRILRPLRPPRHTMYRKQEDAYSDAELAFSVWEDPGFVSILMHRADFNNISYRISRPNGPLLDIFGANPHDGPIYTSLSHFLDVGMFLQETPDGLFVPIPSHILPIPDVENESGVITYDIHRR